MMKASCFLILSACLLLGKEDLSAQSGVYLKSADAPRPSKTPQGIDVRNSSGVDGAFRVRASLAEVRLDSGSSKGDAGMTGRLNVFRKFVRVEISGATRMSQPAALVVKYYVEEDSQTASGEEVVEIDKVGANFIIDTEGFKDKYGTEVKSKKSGSTITSTKYKHSEAEIVGVQLAIVDKTGAELYVGSWPEPVTRAPNLPEHLKPRVYTSVDGKQMTAIVAGVDDESASFIIGGKPYKVPLAKLSAADNEFLKGLRDQVASPAP